LTAGSRLRRALSRIPIDWPPDLVSRHGLESAFERRA
jgi:hypothetical protein